jgi:HD-like signal output (HDOD) protein
LLHNIGKAVTLGAAHDLARKARKELLSEDYDSLVETFHRDVAARVVTEWQLPPPIVTVVSRWEAYLNAGETQFECNIVNLAHRLADCTLLESTHLARDLLIVDPAYRDLGLSPEDGMPLFDSAADINAELDRYLAP